MAMASRTQAHFLTQFRCLLRHLSMASVRFSATMTVDMPASSDSSRSKMYGFVSRIKACGDRMDLSQGKILHAEVQAEGFASHTFAASALVCLYGKCGAVVEAEEAFQAVFEPDTVLCNAMLAAYVKLDRGEKILSLFRQMNVDGIAADVISYISALQACGLIVREEKFRRTIVHEEKFRRTDGHHARQICCEVGRALHSEALRKGFIEDARINTALVCMYSKCHSLSEAENVFLISATKTVVAWNAMMTAYMEQGHVDMPLRLYVEMENVGIKPDHITIVLALRACRYFVEKDDVAFLSGTSSKTASLEMCRALHSVARSKGFATSAYVGTTLVNVYGKCDSISDAEEAFHSMASRTAVSWNAMLSVYNELDYSEKALLLFRQMQHVEVTPDPQSVVCAINACGSLMKKQRAISNDETLLLPIAEMGRCLHSVVRKTFSLAL